MKKFCLILIVIFMISAYAKAVEIPTKIKKHLDSNYPKWKLAESCDLTSKAIVTGDFNGDKKQDYAMVITTNDGKNYFFAFLKRKNYFKTFLLKSNKSSQVSLTVVKKGEVLHSSNSSEYDKPIKLKNQAIFFEDCEYFEESGTYYFDKKEIKSIAPIT